MLPEGEQQVADVAFSKLMQEVDLSLTPKNRDRFTQHITVFRRELTSSNTATSPTSAGQASSGGADPSRPTMGMSY